MRLLNRTTRQVSLTEIDRQYHERCSQILNELEEADQMAGALQVVPRGRLRVYCHQGLRRFVAPVVAGFLGRHPEGSVDLRTGDTMIDLVEAGFDLAISPFRLADSTLVRRKLSSVCLVLCGAPAYLDRHPAPQHPADLAGHNCLRYAHSPFGDEWRFLDAAGTLVALLPDYRMPEIELVALYPHRRHVTAKVRAFIDMLVDRFAGEAPAFSATPV